YGTVTFSRDSGGGVPGVGTIDESGNFSVKSGTSTNMEPGNYAVAIAMRKITVPSDPNAMPVPTLITPKKYTSTTTSGLKAEVKPGSNTFNFDLTTSGGN